MRILVVDDMMSMRQVMMHMLRELGYDELSEATNGMEALKKLRLNHFDLVITDLNMPHMNGKQLLERIRHDEKLTNLPVLMVSCEDDKKKVTDLIQAKVTGFIVKPFNLTILKKHINWIVNDTTTS